VGLVTFSGGCTLLLDDAVQFAGLVAAFNVPADKLDLLDIPVISGTTTSNWTANGANASGTLTISDGTSGTTASINAHRAKYAAANVFTVTSDSRGMFSRPSKFPASSSQIP